MSDKPLHWKSADPNVTRCGKADPDKQLRIGFLYPDLVTCKLCLAAMARDAARRERRKVNPGVRSFR